jgi:hypothetical protein
MQLALLIGANPRSCKHGPAVRLISGKWRLNVQGLEDSSLLLHVKGCVCNDLVQHGMVISCVEPQEIQLHFGVRGNEKYITVVANKVA